MAASMPSLTLEGAAMFSHALSTHKVENDLDFFSAVDDRKSKNDDAGAGMIGTLEFNSAVYYRYAAVNLDLLRDADHLQKLSEQECQQVVAAFIKATVMAVPGARKNSMNASVPPSYVLGIYKDAGQPVQLINAFEAPVRGAGLVDASRKSLEAHHSALKTTWGINTTEEITVPDEPLTNLISKLTRYVR
jgi:CRISPR system Cascade subunit CasC